MLLIPWPPSPSLLQATLMSPATFPSPPCPLSLVQNLQERVLLVPAMWTDLTQT